MASSPPTPDAGFATPAAVVISLAVATIALAVQSRAISALHASQDDYARTQAEIASDGAQTLALFDLYGGQGLHSAGDSYTLAESTVRVRAEPEAPKLGMADAQALGLDVLVAMGASRPSAVQAGLTRLAKAPDVSPSDLATLDPASRWKACARSLVSVYGQRSGLNAGPPGAERVTAHVGEIWRVIATTSQGWSDDRIVRFTGEEAAPARTLDRIFYRNPSGDGSCRLASALPKPPARPVTP